MDSITSIRLTSAGILLVATALCGIVPIAIFRKCDKKKPNSLVSGNKKKGHILSYNGIMKLLMFFGGGILLATCFIHMIPEVRENFDNYFAHRHHPHHHHHHEHSSESHPHHHSDEHDHSHGHSDESDHDHHRSDEVPHAFNSSRDASEESLLSSDPLALNVTRAATGIANGTSKHDHSSEEEGDDHHHHHHHDHSHAHHSDHHHRKREADSTSSDASSDHDDEDHSHHGHSHNHGVPWVELAICGGFFFIYLLEEIIHTFIGHSHDGSDSESVNTSACGTCSPDVTCKTVATNNTDGGYVNYAIDLKNETQIAIGDGDKSIDTTGSVDSSHSKIFHTNSFDELVLPSSLYKGQQEKLAPTSVRFIQGLVVIVAFSAHSIFDGVAIGLQEDKGRLWTMFFAICSHKLVVALAVGMDLFERTKSLAMASILMVVFSLMSPIGIILVIVTESKLSGDDSPVIILLSAVATGTILYIVFFEILTRQRDTDPCKMFGILLYISMLMGFTLMYIMTTYLVH